MGSLRVVAGAVLLGCAGAAVAQEPTLAEAGKKQFRRCAACHTVDAESRSLFGPHLEGIVGRPAGAVENYSYGELLRDGSFVWDEALLDAWLERPNEVMPGMCPSFIGLSKSEDRTALIEYLKNPAP